MLLAWAIAVTVNLGFVLRLGKLGGAVRWIHLLYDAGQLLFVGATIACVAELWRARIAPRLTGRPRVALAARCLLVTAPAFAIAGLFLRVDVSGPAEDLAGERGAKALSWAIAAIASFSPFVAATLGTRVLGRGARRAVAVAVAVALLVLNNLALPADYRGVHLFVTLNATSLVAGALCGLARGPRLRLAQARFIAPALMLLTAPALALVPSNAVRQELSKLDGAIVLPVLARYVWIDRVGQVDVPEPLVPWFKKREGGPSIPPSAPPLVKDPIVLLVSVDSMRADLFHKPQSLAKLPRLTAIRDRSIEFTTARAPAARTITTWASVFIGKYYSAIRFGGDGNRPTVKPDRTPRFSELLTKGGVPTVTYVSYDGLDKNNLARGFSEVQRMQPPKGQQFGLSTDVMPPLIERVTSAGQGPLFVFAHLMDPHYPYDSAGGKGSAYDRFLSEIAVVDSSFGALWDALEQRGLLDRTILIVTADHGEGFGQHGAQHHTVNLYEELIRVPLFVYVPGLEHRVIEQPVSLMDLGPTILDLFGQPTPAHFMGQSLVPLLRGQDVTLTRPIAAERSGTKVIVFGDQKVILDLDHGRDEIYDLSTDPREENNLADSAGPLEKQRLALVRAFFDLHSLKDR